MAVKFFSIQKNHESETYNDTRDFLYRL